MCTCEYGCIITDQTGWALWRLIRRRAEMIFMRNLAVILVTRYISRDTRGQGVSNKVRIWRACKKKSQKK